MIVRGVRIASLFTVTFLCAAALFAQQLTGRVSTESGNNWHASWLELSAPTSFKKGDKLRIKLRGDAQQVLVRLLPPGGNAQTNEGLEGEARVKNGAIEIKLERDHPSVAQISVHSGKEAFGVAIGAANGKASIVSLERVK